MATLKLTSEQLVALRALAAKDATLAGLVPLPKERASGGGVEKQVALMMARDPEITLAQVQAAFTAFTVQRAKFLRRQALNAVQVMRECGRWQVFANETAPPLAEVQPADWPEEEPTAVILTSARPAGGKGRKAA